MSVKNLILRLTAGGKKTWIELPEGGYIHPTTHPATMITQDLAHRFVSDTEKTAWSNASTPVDITGKVDKVTGKSLVSDTLISQIHASGSDNQDLSGKVDKATGKDLSENDLTDALKESYDGAVSHAAGIHAPVNAQKNSDITKEEIEAELTGPISTHSHSGGSGDGFMINVMALTSTPTDSQTVYFGMLPKAPTTTANISRIYIRKSCTLKVAEIYCYSGTAGTNESWSLYVRKNNSADTLIATLTLNTNMRVFSNAALSVSLVAGDYLEIKGVQPLWATNPATCIYGGYLYFE